MIDKKKIIKSVSSMGVCTGITAVLSVVQLSIVARFLTPSDYGFIVIPSVIIGALGVFLMAIPLGLIQREQLSDDQVGSMHQYTMYIGCVLFALVLLAGGALYRIYGERELLYVLLALGVQLLVLSLEITPRMLFRRDMRMEYIATAKVLSAVIGCVVAVVIAYCGGGYWALVYAALARTILSAIYIRVKSDHDLIPGIAGVRAARGMLGFGVSRGIDQVLVQFTGKIDQIVISGMMGQAAVGLYNVSSNVARRPIDLIQPVMASVMFPLYARLRLDRAKFSAFFSDTVAVISLVIMSVATCVSMLAPEVVGLLLGARWQSAVPIVTVIPFYFAFILIGVPCSEVAIASAKTTRMIVWSILNAGLLGLVLLLVVNFVDGLLPVVIAAVALRLILLLGAFPYMLCGSGISWGRPMLRLCLRVLIPVLCFYGIIYSCWGLEVSSAPFGARILVLVLFLLVLMIVNAKCMYDIIRSLIS